MALALATLLVGCGFHLRGTTGYTFAIHDINLVARDPYGSLTEDVRQMLERNNVKITDQAPYTLVLDRKELDSRTSSYTRSARTAERELIMTLAYSIRAKAEGNPTLLENTIEVQRFYTYDGNSMTASDQIATQTEQEMEREIVQQLAMRLQAIKPEELATLAEAAEQKAELERQRQREALERSRQPLQSPLQILK